MFCCWTLLPACNKESFIETVGQTQIESADETEVGYFIFTSKTLVSSCGKATILLNGKVAGYITEDYDKSVSSCTTPPIEGKLIKIIAPTGTYQVTVSVANECRTFNTDTYILKKGVCRYYSLN